MEMAKKCNGNPAKLYVPLTVQNKQILILKFAFWGLAYHLNWDIICAGVLSE